MSGTNLLPANGADLAAAVTQYEYNRLLQMPRSRDLEGDFWIAQMEPGSGMRKTASHSSHPDPWK